MVGFPLLLIPLAIYNIIVFLMPDVSFTDPLVKLTLVSGAEWSVTLSDVLLTLGVLLLLAEVIKGARPGAKYLTDHLLSLIVFGAAAAEFVMWKKFGTSTFFLLTALSLVDFVSGLALRTRRRAVAVTRACSRASGKSRSRKGRSQKSRAAGARAPAGPSAGQANDTAGSLGRRIRAAGKARTEAGAACHSARADPGRSRGGYAERACTGSSFTGNPLAGTAAGPKLSAAAGQAGYAPALI